MLRSQKFEFLDVQTGRTDKVIGIDKFPHGYLCREFEIELIAAAVAVTVTVAAGSFVI